MKLFFKIFNLFCLLLCADACSGSGRPVAVFDATGETVAVLEQMGIRHKWFTPEAIMLGSTSFARYSMLVIGKDSIEEAVRNFRQNIPFAYTVREGFNVLVLSQKTGMIAGLATRPVEDGGFRQVSRDSPLSGFNIPAIASGITAFVKPGYGNFHPIIESELDPELAPVIIAYEGKGKIVFSQFKLVENYHSEPGVAELMRQMISEAMKPAKPAMSRAGYLGGSDGRRVFDSLKLAYRPGTASGYVAFTWLPELNEQDVSQLKMFVERGGIVVTSIPDKDSAAKLPVKFGFRNGAFESGPVPTGALFRGIGADDLQTGETVKTLLITGVDGKPSESHVLGVVQAGKGWIVYIQLLPDMFASSVAKRKISRIWSVIMTNLGISSDVAPDFLLSGAAPENNNTAETQF